MKQIQAKPRQTIPLGHRGENEARKIIFDLTDYIDVYGPGTARLLHQRDGDPAPYIVPAVQADSALTWAVTDEDTAAPGAGCAELQWMVDSVLAKSDIWRTKTTVALDDGATAPPTGAEGWYQQLITYIDSLRGEGVSKEQIAAAVEAYLLEHPVDVPVTSVNGKIGAVELTAEDVGALGQDELQTGVDAALEQAKASGEFDGAPGDPGTDGITPTIGYNGNWYLGDTDTGKPSRGEAGSAGPAGADGADGAPGSDGKSAYQYAQDGGYTGTEAEFAAKLADEMPDTLPNPNALTFTGAVTGSYDGSAPLEVTIPSGGGAAGDYIHIPASAEVGQTIVVKAVDENGKPTEWEAVDLPSGGGQAIDKISIKITETVHSISLLDDITLYNRIRANIKVVGDSANAASGVLGATTPSGILVNYILNATKTATGYLFFDLRLSEQGAESYVTPNFSSQAYTAAALSHVYGMIRTRWTGALSLVPKATDWNFGAGTEIYLEAYRA